MQPITVILINKNNNIDNLLKSIVNLQPEQILLGSFSKVKHEGTKVIELEKTINYNEALNKLQKLAQTDWILYLKDNEILLQSKEYIPNLLNNPKEIYGFLILQDDIIIKEPRLWNKKEHNVVFKNPVFEKPNTESSKIVDIILYHHNRHDSNVSKILETWRKNSPLSVDASYYKAFDLLANKNFTEFRRVITYYLFNMQKMDIPSVMARYYLALVQGIIENNTQEAIQNIIICLAENPLMAEFWCLLGDIFVKSEKFDIAIEFYENAIILGGRRENLDFWPMHISKYGDYPKEMIEKCKKVISTAKVYESHI